MALNEVLTPSSLISATYNPASTVTTAMVEGNGKGHIFTEMQVASGKWVPINSQVGAFTISTPDVTVALRFRAVNIEEDVRVYLGP